LAFVSSIFRFSGTWGHSVPVPLPGAVPAALFWQHSRSGTFPSRFQRVDPFLVEAGFELVQDAQVLAQQFMALELARDKWRQGL